MLLARALVVPPYPQRRGRTLIRVLSLPFVMGFREPWVLVKQPRNITPELVPAKRDIQPTLIRRPFIESRPQFQTALSKQVIVSQSGKRILACQAPGATQSSPLCLVILIALFALRTVPRLFASTQKRTPAQIVTSFQPPRPSSTGPSLRPMAISVCRTERLSRPQV